MRKAPQEIFPKAGEGQGWIWNNDAILLCPCLGCNESEDWWGHSCYRMVLEGVLRGSASPRENYRKGKVQGKAGKREFMASTLNRVWRGCSLKQLSSAVLTVFVCFTPERVHPERTWSAGENNRKTAGCECGQQMLFSGSFLSFFFLFPDSWASHM